MLGYSYKDKPSKKMELNFSGIKIFIE